jgi:hypothetical protein
MLSLTDAMSGIVLWQASSASLFRVKIASLYLYLYKKHPLQDVDPDLAKRNDGDPGGVYLMDDASFR